MSEYSKTKFEETQNLNLNLNLLLGKRKLDRSSSYQNSVWMTHWNKHPKSLDGSSDNRSRFEEQLIIGMNRTRTKNSKNLRTDLDENFGFSFKASGKVLEGSENSELKWGDFPMYGIKQKIESILNRKRKEIGKFDDKVSELNFTYQSSKEYRFETLNPNNNSGVFPNPNSNCSGTEEFNLSSSSQFKCPSMNSIENSKNSSNLGGNYSGNKKKSSSLFEMVSLRSDEFDMRRERKSKSCLENFEDEMIFGKDEGLFGKSDTLVLDSPIAYGSVGGLPSSRAKKAMTVRSSTISNSIATPRNAKPLTKDKQIIKSPETNHRLGPSKIFTLELDSTESQIISPNSNPKSKDPVLSPNPKNNTWLNRLRQNNQNNLELDSSESQILPPISNSKPKDSILSLEAHKNNWLKRLRPNDQNKNNISDKTLVPNFKRPKLNNNNINDPNRVSEQSVKSWIQRWTVPKNSPGEKREQNENLSQNNKEDIEENEKQFPSIHALAMMGKAMNKFRPCEFQRRGPSVVWNSN